MRRQVTCEQGTLEGLAVGDPSITAFVECRSPLHQWGRCVGDHPSRRRLGKVYGVRLTMPRPACNPFRERQTLSMTRNGAWIPPSRSMRIACI